MLGQKQPEESRGSLVWIVGLQEFSNLTENQAVMWTVKRGQARSYCVLPLWIDHKYVK